MKECLSYSKKRAMFIMKHRFSEMYKSNLPFYVIIISLHWVCKRGKDEIMLCLSCTILQYQIHKEEF